MVLLFLQNHAGCTLAKFRRKTLRFVAHEFFLPYGSFCLHKTRGNSLNNLSDERTEYLINDRLSFMRFLGLGLSDRVPDAKTVWLYQKRLTQAGAIDGLFNRFDATLRNAGYLPMSGQILDATLVAAPKQRNTNAEKADLEGSKNPLVLRSAL
jgi:hypothetical protein